MRFFLGFMLFGFLISLYYLLTDEAGSGMGWGVGIFAGIGIGVAVFNYVKFGSVLRQGPPNQPGPQA